MSIQAVQSQIRALEAVVLKERSERCCYDIAEKIFCDCIGGPLVAILCCPCITFEACEIAGQEGCQAVPRYLKELIDGYCTEIPSPPGEKEKEAQAKLDVLNAQLSNTMTRA